jgi:hypothetical protein
MIALPNRTIYRCEHCSKYRLTKAAAVRHELFCRHNPANKHKCFGCQFLSVENKAAGVAADGTLIQSGHQAFTCAKKQVDMYTYVAERRKLLPKLGDVERMPLTCDLYEPEHFSLDTSHPENPCF